MKKKKGFENNYLADFVSKTMKMFLKKKNNSVFSPHEWFYTEMNLLSNKGLATQAPCHTNTLPYSKEKRGKCRFHGLVMT